MANHTITDLGETGAAIVVHGRGSLDIPFTRTEEIDGVPTEVDLSARPIFLEIDFVSPNGIRTPLVADPDNPKGLRIRLTGEQVAKLKTTPTKFDIRDETRIADDLPLVLLDGVISRTGFIGAPDGTEG